MAASAACSNPYVFAHTLRFSARGFLALTKNAWFLEGHKSPRQLLVHLAKYKNVDHTEIMVLGVAFGSIAQ